MRRVVGRLGRDVDGELLADRVQPGGELGDEARVGRAVARQAGLEVDVDAVVVVRDRLVDDRREPRAAQRRLGEDRCSVAVSWQSKRANTSTWRSCAKLVIWGTSAPSTAAVAVALEVRGVIVPIWRSGP